MGLFRFLKSWLRQIFKECKHILSLKGVSLWRQLPKNTLKISHNRTFTSTSVFTLVDKYQDGFRCTNYSQRVHRLFSNATHTLGPKSRGTQSETTLHSTLSSLSFQWRFKSVGKKNFNVHSTHYTQSKNKHICWNNFRDHLVEFDWQHMFPYVTEHLNNPDSPIKMSTEAISYATVSKYARQELTSGKRKNSFPLSLDSEQSAGNTGKLQKKKSEGSFD